MEKNNWIVGFPFKEKGNYLFYGQLKPSDSPELGFLSVNTGGDGKYLHVWAGMFVWSDHKPKGCYIKIEDDYLDLNLFKYAVYDSKYSYGEEIKYSASIAYFLTEEEAEQYEKTQKYRYNLHVDTWPEPTKHKKADDFRQS